MYDFHKEIMKAFVLFLFSIKLIVLARRVKERMYAPGGIGSIAAEDNFGRVAPSASALNERFTRFESALTRVHLRRCGFWGFAKWGRECGGVVELGAFPRSPARR